jgi:hypothetical protein
MKNLEISLPLVNGDLMDVFDDEISGKEIIHELITDDFGAPPSYMRIQITTDSGKVVALCIPYDDTSDASVSIDDEPIL